MEYCANAYLNCVENTVDNIELRNRGNYIRERKYVRVNLSYTPPYAWIASHEKAGTHFHETCESPELCCNGVFEVPHVLYPTHLCCMIPACFLQGTCTLATPLRVLSFIVHDLPSIDLFSIPHRPTIIAVFPNLIYYFSHVKNSLYFYCKNTFLSPLFPSNEKLGSLTNFWLLQTHRRQYTESVPYLTFKMFSIISYSWLTKRCFRVAFSDSEYEEEQTPRYRPDSLASLCRATRFTEAELKRIYRGFKAECPTGVVREETFKCIYSQFFPQGGKHVML